MSKRANVIPSQQLNVALPLPLYTQLSAHLYSELEGRVPHGAYSRFLIDLIRGYFQDNRLDLAAFVGSTPGAFIIQGSPESVGSLKQLLEST